MFIDKENFDAWMERIMVRFDRQDKTLAEMNKHINMLDGDRLLDNQDLCELLNVSKRTVQRYRSSGDLPYRKIRNKTFYKESDVLRFIRDNINKEGDSGQGKLPEEIG